MQGQAVLVIEDNPGDFALVQEFLLEQLAAPWVLRAASYKEAKAMLEANETSYDVILLDLSLPDQTGVPLIQNIVRLSAESPVIVLTGYSDLSFGIKSLSLGISDYILKDELTSALLHKTMAYSRERKKISSEMERSEKQARNFAQQLNQAIEDERLRIAREIHDEFGQQLSGLKMSLSAIKRNEGLPVELEMVIEGLITDVNMGILSLRQIAGQLRPVLLDKLGLFAALEWLFSDFEKRTNIETRLRVAIEQPALNKVHEIHLFRICQEALTNIVKHAAATRVDVSIEASGKRLTITIADNGKGMDVAAAEKQSSMGLLNMRERANLTGASITVHSELYKGTIIKLILESNGKEDFDSR